ncbi:MAG: NCS2 family permease [Actinobacteria bacterium]|nr:NCS2 family permease [Actinomycetota bacterium]
MAKTENDRVVQVGSTGGLDGFFKISERGSTVRTEVGAGVTTWLTMAYILFLNPFILGLVKDHNGVGLDAGQVLSVTALVAGVATLAMGLYANYPFALAAGLGLNGFVAFTLVATLGLSWPEAMGVIVLEGAIITVLVLTNVRKMIMDAISMDLKRAIGIGIGMFIALIGLVNGGIVIKGDATPVTLNPDLKSLKVLVFVVGLGLAATLVSRKVRGGLLIAILGSTVLAIIINQGFGDSKIWANGIAHIPSKWVSAPHFDLLGKFSFGFFSVLGIGTTIAAVLSVMLSDFFDTMGTVTGLGAEAGLLDEDGKLPDIKKTLLVDSLAAVAGGVSSASSNTTYIESASGIADGGRTGLTAAVAGVLFLACLIFSSIAGVIPAEATAPVLVVVGFFMMQGVGEIDWRDPAIGIPSFLTIALMPFTYSITNGVGAGFLAYTVIRILQGKFREVHPLMYVVSAVFAWYFFHGLIA